MNITRPLSYTVTAEDQSKMTTYGKSLLTLKKESDISIHMPMNWGR